MKIFLGVMLYALCCPLSIAANIQDVSLPASEKMGWTTRNPTPELAKKFSVEYVSSDGHCTIRIPRRGTQIRIETDVDADTREIITIKRGFLRKRILAVNFVRKQGSIVQKSKGDDGSWDMFAMKYSDQARHYLDGSLALLRGYYDIKK
jgi:hypothetical protein